MSSEQHPKRRRSIRLRDYDYTSAGAYFITICSYGRQCTFGQVRGKRVHLTALGHVVEDEWIRTSQVRANVTVDEFVVMPNHIHGILILADVGATRRVAPHTQAHPIQRATSGVAPQMRASQPSRATRRVAPTGPVSGSIGAVIGQFKSIVTKRITAMLVSPPYPIWQRNYYEHVIRNNDELNRARSYIVNNPVRWNIDPENPKRITDDDEHHQHQIICG